MSNITAQVDLTVKVSIDRFTEKFTMEEIVRVSEREAIAKLDRIFQSDKDVCVIGKPKTTVVAVVEKRRG